MSYSIGSFNVRDLNYSNKTDDGEKLNRDFEKIAEIIRNEFDIVAIQEVNSERPIKHLKQKLNAKKDLFHNWDGRFVPPENFEGKDPEGYGFIWNSKKIDLLNIKNGKNPQIIKRRIKGIVGQDGMVRNPCFARFSARGKLGGTNFELRIVSVHIRSEKNSEKDALCYMSEKQMRVNEFDFLIKEILPRCCDKTGGIVGNLSMPSYTFMMGDYNLILCSDNLLAGGIRKVTETKKNNHIRRYKTVQELPTTLKKLNIGITDNYVKNLISQGDYYANNFDHFTYELEQEQKLTLIDKRVNVIDKYYKTERDKLKRLELYRMEISDHVPIKLEIDIRKR